MGMSINDLIDYLTVLSVDEYKGLYSVKANNVDINTANGGTVRAEGNIDLKDYMIDVNDEKMEITIGVYDEYYSY